MKLNRILTIVFVYGALVGGTQVASADDNGVGPTLHSVIRVGKKTCFEGHSHSGSGTGATQKVAEMSAINNWAGFTAWEYGTDWANINKAVKRSMKCGRSGGGYSCDLEATPCK